MSKPVIGWITLALFLVFSFPSFALELVTIRASCSGAKARVASSHARQFQAFLDDFCRAGYKPKFIGGWRPNGTCYKCNMHPRGLAIDICQTDRNRIVCRFPPNVSAMAARHGLFHGALWRESPDTGHFEVASESPSLVARLSVHR